MDRMLARAALGAMLLLAGCGEKPVSQNASNSSAAVQPQRTREAELSEPPDPPYVLTNRTGGETPDLAAPELTPEAERGVKGARNILLSFARAIELKQYTQAWAMLGAADQQKWTEAQFAGLFADLRDCTVAIPTGRLEGAAGSSYYSAPITITGSDRQGRPVRMTGEAVVRRVNDVDGASSTQLRWHLDRVKLEWSH